MLYVGETCALLTAVCWTCSATAFAVVSRSVGPLAANQFRGFVALPALAVLAWLCTGRPWPTAASQHQLALLVASGFAGLVLGDLGYFYALAKIGPRLCSVLMACWPACTVAIEAASGNVPNAAVLGGIALSGAGVVLVLLRSRDGAVWNPHVSRRQWLLGVAGGLLGAVGQASGFVLAGYGMAATVEAPRVDALSCTVVRMATAAVGVLGMAIVMRRPFAIRAVFAQRAALGAAGVGLLFGPIGGVWLSMVARSEAEDSQKVGVAAALMATTPIFMMPLARLLYRAPIGRLGVAGTVITVGGAALCWLAR
jgi:drug/metabolite transporter (DMT)-like permease